MIRTKKKPTPEAGVAYPCAYEGSYFFQDYRRTLPKRWVAFAIVKNKYRLIERCFTRREAMLACEAFDKPKS